MRSCCFFGHREIWGESDSLRPLLKQKIEQLIVNESVGRFYLGGYGQFDSLCYEVVTGLKVVYPHIQRIYVLAYYRPFDATMNDKAKNYDDTLYPPLENVPPKFAIAHRNQEIIDMSDFCIFCVNYDWGGAWKTMQYAKRKEKPLINLGKLV